MSGKRAVAYETKVAACADYLLGVPLDQIEQRHGVCRTSVFNWVKARGCFKLRKLCRLADQPTEPSLATPMSLTWQRDVEIAACQRRLDDSNGQQWWTCHRCGSSWHELVNGLNWRPLGCPVRNKRQQTEELRA